MNWDAIRREAWAKEPPPTEWPLGVRPISIDGTALFGLDPELKLYWDGKLVKVKRGVSLTPGQTALAVIATGATFVQAIVAVLDFVWK